MPPHLHPRSRLTTSLFGTTLLVSFLVVGMPHIFPCPAPRVNFADTEDSDEGRRRRRRRRRPVTTDAESEEVVEDAEDGVRESEMMRRKAHECPVPKPRGVIGEVLGFGKRKEDVSLGPTVETKKVER